ncbi:hypothetical protein TSUD_318830 [Trifolium subterraneum]|uniref:pectinesterase n=1 Tax=Trifolium subterraneum TaxID=3900 RepID=A0A2Z6P336_TRISU|nr:hypothetical protein TSUD_318830 [Trifolium subterraneum]
MATTTLSFLFLFFFLLLSTPHTTHSTHIHRINQACKATRFPLQCQTTLISHSLHLPFNPTPLHIINSSISLSSRNLKIANSMLDSILQAFAGDHGRIAIAKGCLQVFQYSHHRTSLTVEALSRGRIKDARAFMSAALAYQYNCWSGLKYANDTELVFKTMSFLDSLTIISSNALSMIVSYDLFGNDTDLWRPPRTERDGFWEDSGSGVFGPGPSLPANLMQDVTVCKETGGGCYGTVQEAVDAAPDNVDVGGGKFVIHIKEGVYEERVRVPLRKKNVVFLGDGIGKTVITGSASVGLTVGMTTYNSATVGVAGDGFMAKDLTFENTAEGWLPWSGDVGLNTLYYGEFDNSGPGSNLTKRVSWSSQVPAEHVSTYSVQGFIQGDDWVHRSSY